MLDSFLLLHLYFFMDLALLHIVLLDLLDFFIVVHMVLLKQFMLLVLIYQRFQLMLWNRFKVEALFKEVLLDVILIYFELQKVFSIMDIRQRQCS